MHDRSNRSSSITRAPAVHDCAGPFANHTVLWRLASLSRVESSGGGAVLATSFISFTDTEEGLLRFDMTWLGPGVANTSVHAAAIATAAIAPARQSGTINNRAKTYLADQSMSRMCESHRRYPNLAERRNPNGSLPRAGSFSRQASRSPKFNSFELKPQKPLAVLISMMFLIR